jgi:hypothetical protein
MSWARIIFLLLVLLAAVAIDQHVILNNGPPRYGIDFQVFERASSDTVELVYREHIAPFAYPPTALILMKPLSALGYWFWTVVSALAFCIPIIIILGRKIAALSLVSTAAIKGLVQGQVPMVLGSLLFFGLRTTPVLGGCLWGVAASVKPQLMLFAPVALLARRSWLMLAGMALGCALMILLSLIFLDPSLWQRWVGAMSNFNEIISGGDMPHVISPSGMAAVAGLPTLPFLIFGLVLGTAAVTIAATKAEGSHLVALVIAASLVASPYAHSYDTIAMIPACVALMLQGRWIYAIPCGIVFIGQSSTTAIALVFLLIALSIETHFKITFELSVIRLLNPRKATDATALSSSAVAEAERPNDRSE